MLGLLKQIVLLNCFLLLYSVLYSLTLSSGNSLRGRSLKNVLFGVFGIVFFLIIPLFIPFDWGIINNKDIMNPEKTADAIFTRSVQAIIMAIHIFYQTIHLIRIIKPTLTHSKNKIVSFLFTRGTVRETFLLKLAASMKTHKMVKHAMDLHHGKVKNLSPRGVSSEGQFKSTNTNALLNYSKESDKREAVGGLLWCWKSYLNRSLIHNEGVMINSRFLLCNILQLLVVAIICFVMPNFTITYVFPNVFTKLSHTVEECDQSTFDPDLCWFPGFAGMSSGVGICREIDFVRIALLGYFFITFLQ